MRAGVIVALVIAWLITPARADPGRIAATVVAVHDGDTITVVIHGGATERVRLAAIDAPELTQPFGRESRDLLAQSVDGRSIELDQLPHRDRWQRLLAFVHVEGRNENLEQLRRGAAILAAERYLSCLKDSRALFISAAAEARSARTGLHARQ